MARKIKNFKLKASLLRIWFIKNLTVFMQVGVLVSIVLVLTGSVDSNTPILGAIFGELSTNIRSIIEKDYDGGTLVNLVTVIFTLFITIGTLSIRLERIALSDIKSPGLKKALIQAGLYFNKNGKLVSRLETAAKIDIDGDGKAGNVDINEIPKEKLVDGVKRASEEFMTIINADITHDSEISQTIADANLKETKQALGMATPEELQPGLIVTLIAGVGDFIIDTFYKIKDTFIKEKLSTQRPDSISDIVSEVQPAVEVTPIAEQPIVQPEQEVSPEPKEEDVIIPIIPEVNEKTKQEETQATSVATEIPAKDIVLSRQEARLQLLKRKKS
jgi:hypothetical protein